MQSGAVKLTQPLRILLLEDSPTDAELNEHMLRKAGIEFDSLRVDTRDTFIRALEEFCPDIILSDYKLPDFDGMAALEIVRCVHPEIPVIMVTGVLSDIDAVELIHAGARDYVLKDRLARLATAVQRALSVEQGIRARKMAEEKFRKITESAQDAIIMMGADQRISFWNAAAARIFGYTAAEAMGQELHILITPTAAHAKFSQAFPHFQESGEGALIGKITEVTALRKGGEEFPVELSISATQFGGQWHAISIVRDITGRKQTEAKILSTQVELQGLLVAANQSRRAMLSVIEDQKRAEKALHESEEKFRNISESAQDGIIMMADKRISFWNAAAERIFGYTAAEALGQEMHALITPPAAHAAFEKAFPYFQQSGEGPIIGKLIEVSALRKGGKEFPVELSVSATQFGGQWHAIGIVRDITERKRTENALHHLNRALKTLGTVNHALVYATNEEVLLHTVCHAIAEDGYQLAWVGYAQHDVNKTIKVMTPVGHEAGYLEMLGMTWADNEHGQGPCSQAVRSSTTQICQNILSDPNFCVAWRNEALKRGYASIISLPLASEEGVFGVLCVHAAETDAFTVGEISLLEEMAADLAFGVSMLRLRLERDRAMKQSQNYLGGLRDSLEETVRAIALTVEMRDPYTAGHQRRVADLATAIAKQLGLPDEQVHGIHLAGVVHDLGKINIPAEILSKPGKITDLEFSLIKIHPQAGYDILKDINFPWLIAQMVLQHHERLDGSGYPQGLKGDAILLEARILAVADVVEAMSSHRPYRPGLGIEVALAEITKQRGIYFDPSVVDACLAVFREQHYSFNS